MGHDEQGAESAVNDLGGAQLAWKDITAFHYLTVPKAAMMTDILLSRDEVLEALRQSQALREGHFALPSGEHANYFLQLPLALRYYRTTKVLCVGLSRLFRGCREVATALPHCSLIAPPSGGIPVAFGIGEALQAEQILWAEPDNGRYRFRQYMEVKQGDKCILVDDVLRSGQTLRAMLDLIRSSGGDVIAAGVLVDQRMNEVDFGDIPFFSLVRLQLDRYPPNACPLCQVGLPLDEVREWI
jgi:orotate phosphoribosyltransferase